MSTGSALVLLYRIMPDSAAPPVLIVLPAGAAFVFVSYFRDTFLHVVALICVHLLFSICLRVDVSPTCSTYK